MTEQQRPTQNRGYKRYSSDVRTQLIKKFKDSGLSQSEFSLREDINLKTFNRWIRNDSRSTMASAFHKPIELDFGTRHELCLEFPNGIRLKWPTGMKACELAALARELLAC